MDITKKRILLTGGAGFIGSNIAKYLVENGISFLRIVDNLSTGHMKNIQPLLNKYENIEFVWGDISNFETCMQIMDGIDMICHQAALGSVPRSLNNPLNSHNSNVNGFINLLTAAKNNGIKRVVFASSSSVYGDSKILPKKEENIGKVLSPYAATKTINEIYGWTFTKCYDMECIGLRYFNVFGPNQDPNGPYAAVIPKFINMMSNDRVPIINGDGQFSRDFTYIDNVVHGNILALTTTNKECFGEIFNIGAGSRTTIMDLYLTIKTILKFDKDPIFGPERNGDIPHSNADINKAKKKLGYKVRVNFTEGILRTVSFYTGISSQKNLAI